MESQNKTKNERIVRVNRKECINYTRLKWMMKKIQVIGMMARFLGYLPSDYHTLLTIWLPED
jgi:hypothetical protein